MYRSRKNAAKPVAQAAAQDDCSEISEPELPEQPISRSVRNNKQAATSTTSTRQPTFRPVTRAGRPGLLSISTTQAAQQPAFRSAGSIAQPSIEADFFAPFVSRDNAQPAFRPARSIAQPSLPSIETARDTSQPTFTSARDSGQASFSAPSASRGNSNGQPIPQPILRAVRSIGVQVNLPPLVSAQDYQQPMPRAVDSIRVQVDIPLSQDRQPIILHSTEDNRQPTTSAATTPRVARQTPFRPVRRGFGLASSPDIKINAPATSKTTPGAEVNVSAPTTSSLILEFVCLYSNDLRRKHKRWQDGTIKFHTFNQKFMMYDDNGVFVGEGHWQGDKDSFQEGLETKLDRPMVCVQVMECTGSKDQDLTQVLGKRAREVEERRAKASAKRTRDIAVTEAPSPRTPSRNTSTAATFPNRPRYTSAAATFPNRLRNTSLIPVSPTFSRDASIVTISSTPPRHAPAVTISKIPSRDRGAWTEHADDLLGMRRPTRR